MKNLFLIVTLTFFTSSQIFAQTTSSIGNALPGAHSSGLGTSNTASGNQSVAQGFNNTASGDQSVAQGFNSRAKGAQSFAAGHYSTSNGLASFALGARAVANTNHAMAFGIDVRANGNRSMVIGTGTNNGPANALQNNIPNSLMIGYNSTLPTVFVGTSTGNNTLGRVGIGNSTPESRLHVFGDIRISKSDRIIFGQSSDGVGEWIQNSNPLPSNSSGSHGLSLFANFTERMRISNLGMVGIGTSNPTATFHVVKSTNQLAAPSLVRIENLPTTNCGYIVMVDDNGYMFRSPRKGNPCIDTGTCSGKRITNDLDIFKKYEDLEKRFLELNNEVQRLKLQVTKK